MNNTGGPPEKLSDLIELAITDARALNRETYVPNHCVWHNPEPNNQCSVCLAGAIIARTLGRRPEAKVAAESAEAALNDGSEPIESRAWRYALHAIDDAREGDWWGPLDALNIYVDETTTEKLENVSEPDGSHFSSWAEFTIHLDSMSECARELREIGL